MQIPGLNLLNGTSPVVALLPNKSSAPSVESPSSPQLSDAVVHNTLSALDVSHLGDGPVDGRGPNSGESVETATSSLAVIPQSPDPLDAALEENSDKSLNSEPENEEAPSESVDGASSDSEDEELEALIKSAPTGALQGLEDEYDENEDRGNMKDIGATGLRTKNEVAEELGPVHLSDVSITDQTVIEYLGTVERVMESVAIVRAHTDGEYRILDEGGVVVTESRSPIGTIAETFGPVKEPRYLVRLAENLLPSEHPGSNQPLYYVPEFASFVFTQALRGLKGSDASNFYDEEVNDEEKEFSDDEAEIAHKRNLKRKRAQDSARKSARPGQNQGTPSINRSESVDPSQAIHYTPLSRPNTSNSTTDRYTVRPARKTAENRSSYVDREASNQQHRHMNDAYYPQNLHNSTLYNQGPSREQPFPRPRYYGYNEPTTAHRTFSSTEINSGMGPSHYPPLPPGAYVNPAFFQPTEPTNLPPDIQQQMEILYNLQRQPPGG